MNVVSEIVEVEKIGAEIVEKVVKRFEVVVN